MVTATQNYTIYQLGGFSFDAIKPSTQAQSPLEALDVRVRFKACSLNYRDILMAKGIYNPKLKLPLIPLSDGAGEVVEVGPNVTRVKVGDRIMPNFMVDWLDGKPDARASKSALGGAIDGVLREYGVFKETSIVTIPEHLSFEEAAALPCAAVTAWNGLVEQGGVKPGDTVLTMGSGGVSTFALQFATMSGAEVIATSSSDEKLERLKALGAKHLINYKKEERWDKRVLEITGGRGVDHVIEVGGAGTLERSLSAVKMGGHVSLIGVLSGPAGAANPMSILMKNIRVHGVFVGSVRVFEDMNKAIRAHKLKPTIDKVFPATQIKEALEYMEHGSHFGKVVVTL